MAFLILCLVVIAFFLWGDQLTRGGVARQRERTAPDSPDAVASPPISERSAGAWRWERWERWESIGTFTPKTHGGPVAPRAVASALPPGWTALDDHQLNRLLNESSSWPD